MNTCIFLIEELRVTDADGMASDHIENCHDVEWVICGFVQFKYEADRLVSEAGSVPDRRSGSADSMPRRRYTAVRMLHSADR